MDQFLKHLDKQSLAIIHSVGVLAKTSGMKAYLVGGPVRDLMLKRLTRDLDIAVEGRAMDLARAFAAKQEGKLLTYPAFGTATVNLPGRRSVDFTTARKERYPRPGAFPEVTFARIKDDLFRRDFTVNAVAIALGCQSWGKVIDPFEGREDLKAGKIRILHPTSFMDDPTRILRAARFAGRFRFTIERSTLKCLKQAVKDGALNAIKPQRYAKEYNKILKEDLPQPALDYLRDWGALKEQYYVAH